jgi:hypothetical protein
MTGERTDGHLPVRSSASEELLRYYGRTFRDLRLALESLEKLDFLCLMHSTEEMLHSVPGKKTTVRLNSGDSHLIMKDLVESAWSACLCFRSGFTGTCRDILRRAYELAVHFFCAGFAKRGSAFLDERFTCLDGTGSFGPAVSTLRGLLAMKDKSLARCLGRIHGCLCEEASRKGGLPRPTGDARTPGFDPLDILYTKGLFFCLLDMLLRLVRMSMEEGRKNLWCAPIMEAVCSTQELVGRYGATVERFVGGYLLHGEEARISPGINVIYSVSLDGGTVYHGSTARGLNKAQLKRLDGIIRQRLLTDSY